MINFIIGNQNKQKWEKNKLESLWKMSQKQSLYIYINYAFKKDTASTTEYLVCTIKEVYQGKKHIVYLLVHEENVRSLFYFKLRKKIQIQTRRCKDAIAAILSGQQIEPFYNVLHCSGVIPCLRFFFYFLRKEI